MDYRKGCISYFFNPDADKLWYKELDDYHDIIKYDGILIEMNLQISKEHFVLAKFLRILMKNINVI